MEKIDSPDLKAQYYNAFKLDKLFGLNLLNEMSLVSFSPKEYLCQQEEEMTDLLFLVHGHCKVSNTLPNGKSLLLSFYMPFKMMGDAEFIKGDKALSTVQAISEVYCLALPMDEARKLLAKDYKFLSYLCETLSVKLGNIGKNSSINLLYPLENRLASYINAVAVMEQGPTKGYLIFDENLTLLSELLGTSYRHLLRTLNGLCAKEVLKKEKNYYRVINQEGLGLLAGDLYQESNFL